MPQKIDTQAELSKIPLFQTWKDDIIAYQSQLMTEAIVKQAIGKHLPREWRNSSRLLISTKPWQDLSQIIDARSGRGRNCAIISRTSGILVEHGIKRRHLAATAHFMMSTSNDPDCFHPTFTPMSVDIGLLVANPNGWTHWSVFFWHIESSHQGEKHLFSIDRINGHIRSMGHSYRPIRA